MLDESPGRKWADESQKTVLLYALLILIAYLASPLLAPHPASIVLASAFAVIGTIISFKREIVKVLRTPFMKV